MNGSPCYDCPRWSVWLLLTIALVACSAPPTPRIRTQGPHLVQLDDLQLLVRPGPGVAVQVTYLPEADPPGWDVAWPASAPQTRLRFAIEDGKPLLQRLGAEDEVEQLHAFAVTQSPRGRSLGIDLVARANGGYSLAQVMGDGAPVSSASFGAVETLSSVRVGGR